MAVSKAQFCTITPILAVESLADNKIAALSFCIDACRDSVDFCIELKLSNGRLNAWPRFLAY